jgi:hypothetical protein
MITPDEYSIYFITNLKFFILIPINYSNTTSSSITFNIINTNLFKLVKFLREFNSEIKHFWSIVNSISFILLTIKSGNSTN